MSSLLDSSTLIGTLEDRKWKSEKRNWERWHSTWEHPVGNEVTQRFTSFTVSSGFSLENRNLSHLHHSNRFFHFLPGLFRPWVSFSRCPFRLWVSLSTVSPDGSQHHSRYTFRLYRLYWPLFPYRVSDAQTGPSWSKSFWHGPPSFSVKTDRVHRSPIYGGISEILEPHSP